MRAWGQYWDDHPWQDMQMLILSAVAVLDTLTLRLLEAQLAQELQSNTELKAHCMLWLYSTFLHQVKITFYICDRIWEKGTFCGKSDFFAISQI